MPLKASNFIPSYKFAFKIYQIVVILQGSGQQTLSEKESFVKYQENENLQ